MHLGAASCASTASSPSTAPTPPTDQPPSSGDVFCQLLDLTGLLRFRLLVGLSFFSGHLGGDFLSLVGTLDCRLMHLGGSFLRLNCILTLDRA